jgi:hypothetical protein
MKLFDYIYYRWFRIYAKADSQPDLYASGIVTAYQTLTIINLVSITWVIQGYDPPSHKYIYPLTIFFFITNYFRYERGFDIAKLDEMWMTEPTDKKKLRFIFLVGYLCVVFFVPIIYGIATH